MVTWTEDKRQRNIRKHGIDFVGAEAIFDQPMVTHEDDRDAYSEQRFKSLALLKGRVVVVVWTARGDNVHFISIRKAERHEQKTYFKFVTR